MERQMKGLTLVEIMIAVTLLSIFSLVLLLLFSQGVKTYNQGKSQHESFNRLRGDVEAILKGIRGAKALKSGLPATGSNAVQFAIYTVIGGTKCIKLEYLSETKNITRTRYNYDEPPGSGKCDTNTESIPDNPKIIAANVDSMRFYPDDTLLRVEYVLVEGLTNPVTYQYKLMYSPKPPEASSEEE